MAVILAYLVFLPIAALCFFKLPLRTALLLVLIGGWWALPVGRYGPGAPGTDLPWWITGIALPSDMLLTKAWIPPLVAFAGAAIRNPAALLSWRPAAIDSLMIGWCAWPLADSLGVAADPPSALASLYVIGAWGLPWLIGRVWLAGPDGQLELTKAIALSGLANIPVAIVEGVRPAMLYGMVYSPHPFRFDGVTRYIGHRPIGFLEHGNLYGLWAALAAFAAVWLSRDPRRPHHSRWVALAIVNCLVAAASQSVGALMLFALGTLLMVIWRSRVFLPTLAAAGALLLLTGAVYLSGVLPIRALAKTPAGVTAIAEMRAIGRGSFLWRVSQDAKSISTITAHPIGGTSRWDWWRPYGIRPWGEPLLLIGQFGLIGFFLAWGALLAACIATFVRLNKWGDRISGSAALPLAIIVLLSLCDAALNAFFFSPSILAAGAIASSRLSGRVQPERTPGRPLHERCWLVDLIH